MINYEIAKVHHHLDEKKSNKLTNVLRNFKKRTKANDTNNRNLSSKMSITSIFCSSSEQNPIEPMQVDAPAEDNENNEEETYSIENPTIDLDFYSNSYTGLAKLHRLIFIADHCPSLRLEALKMAISYVMSTYNVQLYQHLHRKVQLTRSMFALCLSTVQ